MRNILGALRKSSVAVVSPLVSRLVENVRDQQKMIRKRRFAVQPTKSYSLSRFASIAKDIGKKAALANHLVKNSRRRSSMFGSICSSSDDGRTSVLTPENRRYLDLQNVEDDVPKRRIILGGDSFSVGRNGEIIDNAEDVHASQQPIRKCVEDKRGRKDSAYSIISSATSLDSKEEEMKDQLYQLRQSLIRKQNTSSTTNDYCKLRETLPNFNDPSVKKRHLMMRLSSGSKRKSYTSQSSISSWEMEHQITEEESSESSLQHQIILEKLIIDPNNSKAPQHSFHSDLESNVFESDKDEANFSFFKKNASNSDESSKAESNKNFCFEDDSKNIEDLKKLEQQNLVEKENIECLDKLNQNLDNNGTKFSLAMVGQSYNEDSELNSSVKTTSPLLHHYHEETSSHIYAGVDDQSNEEILKSTLDKVQNNFNTAMLAVLQASKTQQNLHEMLLRRDNKMISSLNLVKGNEQCENETMRSSCSDANISDFGTKFREEMSSLGSQEALDIASQMRTSINSVMNQLERYLTDICPQLQEPRPDISNTIGQMLYLSQHQSQLCSELERMSLPDFSQSPSRSSTPNFPPSFPPFRSIPENLPFQPLYPNSYRSVPENLNSHHPYGTPSVSSCSQLSSNPFSSFVFSPSGRFGPYHSQGNIAATYHSQGNFAAQTPYQKNMSALSESSCDGSVELGTEVLSEGRHSQANSSILPNQPSTPNEQVTKELREKIFREIEETNAKVDKLNEKMEKNFNNMIDLIAKHFSSSDR